MATQAAIEDFVSQKTLARVGASRHGKKFGNRVLRELKTRYQLLLVHPEAATIDGEPCYPSLLQLPRPVDGEAV